MCVANTRRNFRPSLVSSDILYTAPTAESEPLKVGSACDNELLRESSPSLAARCRGNVRRRHALLPGKTAKNHDRHFVMHCYHDHAQDKLHDCQSVPALFPIKLHEVLDEVERDGLDGIISWAPHGRCFVIHEPKEFVEQVLPK